KRPFNLDQISAVGGAGTVPSPFATTSSCFPGSVGEPHAIERTRAIHAIHFVLAAIGQRFAASALNFAIAFRVKSESTNRPLILARSISSVSQSSVPRHITRLMSAIASGL